MDNNFAINNYRRHRSRTLLVFSPPRQRPRRHNTAKLFAFRSESSPQVFNTHIKLNKAIAESIIKLSTILHTIAKINVQENFGGNKITKS